jgi:hypothetical protein
LLTFARRCVLPAVGPVLVVAALVGAMLVGAVDASPVRGLAASG